MEKPFQRAHLGLIQTELKRSPRLIHVLMGPRQVGKTTLLTQLQEQGLDAHIATADGELLKPGTWLREQWELARTQAKEYLVVDEIQKVENWSEVLKDLWDTQARRKGGAFLKVLVTGSSSFALHRGLSESLTGRFWQHPIPHWGFAESQEAFDLTLEQYLRFGGYPGSYAFIDSAERWQHYLQHSVIDAVLGRDILAHARVKSPALFRQCFEIACAYPAQELSYNKLLGQLQEKGNTDLVKNYLELFEWAFLLRKLFKSSNKKLLTRTSSPKLLPLCPALFSTTLHTQYTAEDYGRALELAVGAELNQMPGELGYWREGNFEIDFTLKRGRKLLGIEVKWGKKQGRGLSRFQAAFPQAEVVVIDRDHFTQGLAFVREQLAVK